MPKGFIVVRGYIMNIRDHEKILCGLADLGDAGQYAIGGNIPIDPGIAVDAGDIAADGVKQKCPVVF